MNISGDITITVSGECNSNADVIAYMVFHFLQTNYGVHTDIKLSRIEDSRIKEIHDALIEEPVHIGGSNIEIRALKLGPALYDL